MGEVIEIRAKYPGGPMAVMTGNTRKKLYCKTYSYSATCVVPGFPLNTVTGTFSFIRLFCTVPGRRLSTTYLAL
jgi:hypothetical protein